MSEAQTWHTLGTEMRRRKLDPVRIENVIEVGTSDVNYTLGWCELKFAPAWPKRGGPLRISHFTPQQRAWILRRSHAGGRAVLVLKVGKEWYVIPPGPGLDALYHGEMTEERCREFRCASVSEVVDRLCL